MKNKIRLETLADINDFVNIVSTVEGPVRLEDGTGFVVNAKSLIGAMYTVEWEELWCVSEADIYRKIERFIADE